MKLLNIRLKNLHSLQGETFIDFSNPPLSEASLFAITGETGAGKSTLLDAITLALYGKTHRYANTIDTQENIMSKGTGECFAEITFEIKKQIYRARWENKRAGKKQDGNIQSVDRFLQNLHNPTETYTKIKEIENKIETELLQLDYEQFTKSVLLAQGDFNRFLTTKPQERIEFLEKITGISVFKELGMKAFQKNKLESQKIADISNQLAVINPLSKEEIEEKRNAKTALKEKEEKINIETITPLVNKIEQKKKLLTELKDLQEKQKKLDTLIQDEKTTQQKKAALEKEIQNNIGFAQLSIDDLVERIKTTQKQKDELAEIQKKDFPKDLNSIEDFLAQKNPQGHDINHFNEQNEKYQRYITPFNHLLHYANEIEKNETHEKAETQKEQILQKELETITQQKTELAEKVELAETLVKSEEENLQKALLISKYEEDRAHLQQGEPCPLCGSKEHHIDYLPEKGNLEETQKKLEKAKEQLKKYQNEYQKTNNQAIQKNTECNSVKLNIAKYNQNIKNAIDAFQKINAHDFAKKPQNYQDINKIKENLNKTEEVIAENKKIIKNIEYKTWLQTATTLTESIREKEEKTNAQLATIHETPPPNERQALANWVRALEKKAQEYQQLNNEIQKIERDIAGIESLKKETQQNIESIQQKLSNYFAANPEASLASLIQKTTDEIQTENHQLATFREEINQINKEIGSIEATIASNEKQWIQKNALTKTLEEKQKEGKQWDKLNSLIGDAKGSKFNGFAQSLTMDTLLYIANEHLQELNPRYLLQKHDKKEKNLDLEIIDLEQAGAVRLIASLSGGETFLVSLALALALSDMVSQKAQINTLFIDEGFGTLDPLSLEIALDALDKLRARGKTIGIISHVELIKSKDRIPTQIEVRKKGGGISQVTIL
ncbi:MAG: hypothetical protein EAZ55_14425 [Cytophagales bacterium]|nr:MAG: hypothetical protein EAZ55_14425 [Cytophagales bacterium]